MSKLLLQYKVDIKDGCTIAKTFDEWLSVQSATRVEKIQSKEVEEIAASCVVGLLLPNISSAVRTATKVVGQSKMSLARQVYAEAVSSGTINRQSILTRFIEEVGLTAAGAATYYATIRNSK